MNFLFSKSFRTALGPTQPAIQCVLNQAPKTTTNTCIKSSIFWDITPCSPLSVNRRFGGTYRLHLQGRRIRRARNQCESRWQAELEAMCSSETSVDFQRTEQRYIPEDGTLHNHRWENFKSYNSQVVSQSVS
jgi:hypothetical protein